MYPHFIAIPFPKHVQSRLASLCYGLPQVRWVEEENFHLTLRHFGPLSDTCLANIQEHLATLFFSPFSLVLQGVDHFHSKGKRGVIWIGVKESSALHSLKKEINRQLRDLALPPDEHFHSHVTLGYYERLNPQRLGDYLLSLADYQSEPIEVTSCLLMRSQQTPQRVIYQIIDEFLAFPKITGED